MHNKETRPTRKQIGGIKIRGCGSHILDQAATTEIVYDMTVAFPNSMSVF